LLDLLGDLGIKYVYSPYMVRGLDYYTDTVFVNLFRGFRFSRCDWCWRQI